LLVEDEPVIAMTAEDMIEELGGAVVATAGTLEEAMQCATELDFDLALLDINLNGTMSTPVAHLLAEAGKRFAFTTGYGGASASTGGLAAPIISKPYTITTLGEAINDLLRA
jgi:CheY-like chemotaxis protein